jgi:putative Holliday junction resolvase
MRAMGAVLAIDVGTKKTGFAIADALRIIAQPLEGVRAGEDDPALLDHVSHLLSERDVAVFLVGLPRNMDGSEGARAAAVRAFAGRLAARFPGVAVVTWDERLTTKAAEELLREAGFGGREAKGRKDSWSALVLLRDWMESGEPGG